MSTSIRRRNRWAILLSFALASIPTISYAKTFSDSTFNLADYTQSTFQTGGGTVTVSQTTTDGNPGSALVVITDAPATQTSYAASVYFIRDSFSWNPATDGTLSSVSWSEDVYLTNTPGGVTAISGDLLMFQSGNYYVNYASLPTNTGVFQTASANNLTATGFSLVTDLATGGTNTAVHPDFSEPLAFGFLSGAFRTSADSDHTVVKADNLSIQASSEAATADFNANGKVDAADYVFWRKYYGDAPRYDLWRRNYGVTVAPGLGSEDALGRGASVPEPAALNLIVVGVLSCLMTRSQPDR